LSNAAKAMGVENLRTISFSGTGSNAGDAVGQSRNPNVAWPVARMKTYSRQIDLDGLKSQVQLLRVQDGRDQADTQIVDSNSSWNTQFAFWLTPWGFLKGASANSAAVGSATLDGKRYSVVTFTPQNRPKVVAYINDQNLIERVQTTIENQIVGQMPAEAWYGDYKDFEGLKVPTLIIEKLGGFPVTILSVSDVKANIPVNIPAAPAALDANAESASVQTEKVADGVYYLRGSAHHSVAVEFADHVVVIEAPLNGDRAAALMAEVKRLIPSKPIRYVVNTHHHFDHSGGLRAFAAGGATIITHEINADFFSKALGARIEAAADKKTLSDGVRTVELHVVRDSPHHDGLLMAFLPKEKLLIEAEPFDRSAGNLIDNAERLKLDYETVLPLHGGSGKAPRADLYAAVRRPLRDMKDILSAQAAGAQGQRGQRGQAAAAAGANAAAPAGQQILEKTCTACHNLNRVENKKLNEADWRAIVSRMQGRGAALADGEADTLVQYLVNTYGPQ